MGKYSIKFDEWGFPIYLDKYWIRNNCNDDSKYPPYNIGYNVDEQSLKRTSYFIEVALAGLQPEELEVKVYDEAGVKFLMIKHRAKPYDQRDRSTQYSVQGIAKRSFDLKFELGKNTEVSDVEMKDGILTVFMKVVTPEEEKPKIFEIKKGVN